MFRHYNPTELHFGTESIDKAGGLAARYGQKALVVTGRSSMQKTGALERLVDNLQKHDLTVDVFDEVEPNPSFATVDRGALRAATCDVVIGIGGGSPMDAAKAIAITAANKVPVASFFHGTAPKAAMPILEIATTSGTGSEVDRYLVLTDQNTHEKQGWGHRLTYPQASIVDVNLLKTMPPRLTAATGLDAFFHSFESYISTGATPLSDLYAQEAMLLVVANLKNAYRDGDDLKARTNMAWASTLAGLAIDGARTTLLHGLEHPVSGHLDVPHGEGLAALSLAFLTFIAPSCPDKCASVAGLLGETMEQLPVKDAASKSITGLRRLLQSVDMDISLTDLGVTQDLIDDLVRDAAKSQHLLDTTPRPTTPEDIRHLYEESL